MFKTATTAARIEGRAEGRCFIDRNLERSNAENQEHRRAVNEGQHFLNVVSRELQSKLTLLAKASQKIRTSWPMALMNVLSEKNS